MCVVIVNDYHMSSVITLQWMRTHFIFEISVLAKLKAFFDYIPCILAGTYMSGVSAISLSLLL